MNEQIFNIKFVNEVEKHPLLYNSRLKGYSKKSITDNEWKEVAKAVHLTVKESKERWKNIRSVFVRHLKPLPPESGRIRRRPYYLHNAMKFTLPFIKMQGISEEDYSEIFCKPLKKSTPEQNCAEVLSESSQDHVEKDNETNSLEADATAAHTACSRDSQLAGSPRREAQPSLENLHNSYVQKRRKKNFDCTQTPNNMETSNVRTEEKKMFLLSLLPEIEPMTDVQMKSFRRKILQLIDDIFNPNQTYVNLPPNVVISTDSLRKDYDSSRSTAVYPGAVEIVTNFCPRVF